MATVLRQKPFVKEIVTPWGEPCVICKKPACGAHMADVSVCEDCFFDAKEPFRAWCRINRPDLLTPERDHPFPSGVKHEH